MRNYNLVDCDNKIRSIDYGHLVDGRRIAINPILNKRKNAKLNRTSKKIGILRLDITIALDDIAEITQVNLAIVILKLNDFDVSSRTVSLQKEVAVKKAV